MKDGRSAFNILKGKPTGKRPLGKSWHRWEDNIRMDLEEIGININIYIYIYNFGGIHSILSKKGTLKFHVSLTFSIGNIITGLSPLTGKTLQYY